MTESRKGSGLTSIALATVIAGVAGYVITWLVFRLSGAEDYALFATFWAAAYLVVGTLSGIQHEITRATRQRVPGQVTAGPVARNFAAISAVAVLALVVALTPVWVFAVFTEPDSAWLVAPLAVSTASYVLVAVVGGTLYGLHLWRPLASMIALDGLLRLATVGIALALGSDVVGLGWAVALPFPLAVGVVWLAVRREVVGRSELDVSSARLSWNVLRTVAAAASMAALVSGFPVLLKLASPDVDTATLGVLILAITLVRAPLIVSAMSLQSYLIVLLRATDSLARLVLTISGAIAAAVVVIMIPGVWLGPDLFVGLFGEEAIVDGGFIAVLVASSGFVAAMFVTGAALLGRADHVGYSAGWALAVFATVVALVIPLPFDVGLSLALAVGPAVGVAVHVACLVNNRAQRKSNEH